MSNNDFKVLIELLFTTVAGNRFQSLVTYHTRMGWPIRVWDKIRVRGVPHTLFTR